MTFSKLLDSSPRSSRSSSNRFRLSTQKPRFFSFFYHYSVPEEAVFNTGSVIYRMPKDTALSRKSPIFPTGIFLFQKKRQKKKTASFLIIGKRLNFLIKNFNLKFDSWQTGPVLKRKNRIQKEYWIEKRTRRRTALQALKLGLKRICILKFFKKDPMGFMTFFQFLFPSTGPMNWNFLR
jgi:hypothetical protein